MAYKEKDYSSPHENHRDRMRERFLAYPDSFSRHEIIEILLYNIIPRRDVNPLAHRLIARFHSVGGVLGASEEELTEVSGVGKATAEYLTTVGKLCAAVRNEKIEIIRLNTLDKVVGFIGPEMKRMTTEVLCVFCLDKNDVLLQKHTFTQGKGDGVTVPFRDIGRACLTADTANVILAHNHPTDTCAPSEKDDDATSVIGGFLMTIGIKLYDHVIVGTDGVYSYRHAGMLDRILGEENWRPGFGD